MFDRRRNQVPKFAAVGLAAYLAAFWGPWVVAEMGGSLEAAEQVVAGPSRYLVTPERMTAFFTAARTFWPIVAGLVAIGVAQNKKKK